ncbi:DUF3141 domain-containing protein [Beijerinckia indica]|uniref:3-hydroxyalkanoate synthetase n=1 Tax=Beijerinckia indica subsp. indica (strain ATCC 9039 / DSM 1715 / NCIMB 8712) TaxID=395963 RepID=B2ICG9_BEII9|nr:DUF3141 domain-containing protein [Beijerinckia indica]ACB93858.1 conserved hypothetical protein [Beijerinckia indica subsp. indica ATCC 9039]
MTNERQGETPDFFTNPFTAFWPTGAKNGFSIPAFPSELFPSFLSPRAVPSPVFALQGKSSPATSWIDAFGLKPYQDYWQDAWQRSILFLDILRQRGDQYLERSQRDVPHVLSFGAELILDGRTFERPVNYGLVRIIPPQGVTVDPTKRPFIIFDPRAGHGPGIGGMKHDSEIGEVLKAGHPCYFVGFLPQPVPGQTIEDVCRAEALFVKKVAELHPDSDRKPTLIGNCQAGWQIAMMSALNPDLPGPLLLAGAPLSYWAGVHGRNPLRYLGGLLGGTWMTTLAGDLGNGIFDGAALVANFERMNPANTYWKKNYNVYSKVDSEAPRFLDFESWWGNPITLNAQEMQFIADELFVGNKLTCGEIVTSDNVRVDLRNIKSPIIVFCSWGDDITPPQQALGWITDLYDSRDEIVANGQTIVYTLHDSIGHLGIFVSGKIATREHGEFTQAMDLIDLIPPGLYEAVIADVGQETANPELIEGRYLLVLQPRNLDDIRALGGNDLADERRFASLARLSDVNQGLYRTFASPVVRSLVTKESADYLRRLHPNRLRYAFFSDRNPWLRPVKALAEHVRANRHPVTKDNPFVLLEQGLSNTIISTLENYGHWRDTLEENFFLTFYGSPTLQALLGLGADPTRPPRQLGREVTREAIANAKRAALEFAFDKGSTVEAFVRASIYIHQPIPSIDERVLAALKEVRQLLPTDKLTFSRFKDIVKQQHQIVLLDEKRALATLPQLLPASRKERTDLFEAIQRLVLAGGQLPEEAQKRLFEIKTLLSGAKDQTEDRISAAE